MPHEVPGVFHALLHHSQGFRQDDLEQAADAADAVSQKPLGSCWFRPEGVVAKFPFASALQATYSDLSKVDLELPEGLLIGLGYAATNPDSPLDFHNSVVQERVPRPSWPSRPLAKVPQTCVISLPSPESKLTLKRQSATAKHCIVIHGQSTFLSGNGLNLDFDQECFYTR